MLICSEDDNDNADADVGGMYTVLDLDRRPNSGEAFVWRKKSFSPKFMGGPFT